MGGTSQTFSVISQHSQGKDLQILVLDWKTTADVTPVVDDNKDLKAHKTKHGNVEFNQLLD